MISPLYPIISSWYPIFGASHNHQFQPVLTWWWWWWSSLWCPARGQLFTLLLEDVQALVSPMKNDQNLGQKSRSQNDFGDRPWDGFTCYFFVPFDFFLSFLNLLGNQLAGRIHHGSQKPPGWRVSHPLLLLLEDGLQGARHVEVLQEALSTART